MKYIITESQRQTLLMETVSPPIRRRLSFENMKDEMDSIIEHTLNPCDFDDAGTFIEDACDMFVYVYLEDLQASSKDKDSLYYYAVDVFGKYLVDIYNERCGGKDGLNESVGDLSRKAKILKRYTEDMLSEKPWFNGLDITISNYQTSHKDENGRRYLTTIPIFTFKINTSGIPKSISYNDVIKLENEVSDIVVPLFTSMFPYDDEDDNLDAVWDTKFDFHL
jgi:hypothetical protein